MKFISTFNATLLDESASVIHSGSLWYRVREPLPCLWTLPRELQREKYFDGLDTNKNPGGQTTSTSKAVSMMGSSGRELASKSKSMRV